MWLCKIGIHNWKVLEGHSRVELDYMIKEDLAGMGEKGITDWIGGTSEVEKKVCRWCEKVQDNVQEYIARRTPVLMKERYLEEKYQH